MAIEGTVDSKTTAQAVIWRAQYSVGIASIDSEHQKLIGMINELHAAMQAGHGKDVIGKTLDGLAAYTVSHFSREEQLMQQHRFPGFVRHKAEHDKAIKQVEGMQQNFRRGAGVSVEVLTFLVNWLIGHIVGMDKQYTALMQAAGVK
jgi:hemerythrin-like metal-binding protein